MRNIRRVGGDGNTLLLAESEELLLDEVGVVLNLKSGGADAAVTEEIHQQSTLEVGNTNALGEALVNDGLEALPGLLDGGLGLLDGTVGHVPAGGVRDGRVDVFESDGEVDEEEIEVLKAPPFELLADNGLDVLLVVEGVPELGDDEELLTLDETLINGALHTLAALLLITVVCAEWVKDVLR